MKSKEDIEKLEKLCKTCFMYNSFGCANRKGEIICDIRDDLIDYKRKHKELPYNWKRYEG